MHPSAQRPEPDADRQFWRTSFAENSGPLRAREPWRSASIHDMAAIDFYQLAEMPPETQTGGGGGGGGISQGPGAQWRPAFHGILHCPRFAGYSRN
jgi:hypothetical protein